MVFLIPEPILVGPMLEKSYNDLNCDIGLVYLNIPNLSLLRRGCVQYDLRSCYPRICFNPPVIWNAGISTALDCN